MRGRIPFRDIVLVAVLVLVILQFWIIIAQNNRILTFLGELSQGHVRVPGLGERNGPDEESAGEDSDSPVRVDVNALMEKAAAFRPRVGKVGGEIVYVTTADPKTFNLVLNKEATTSDIMRICWEELVRQNYVTNEWEPHLATRWEMSDDGLTCVFHLRRDVRWSDGEPLTADDVVFSYNDILNNPQIDVGGKGALIFREYNPDTGDVVEKEMKVEKVDDYTVRFLFPFRTFDALSRCTAKVYPEHVLRKYVEDGTFNTIWDVSTDPADLVCSGPWRLGEYKPGERAVLVRNPKWWMRDAAGNALPYLERIVFSIVPSADTAYMKFGTGEVDFISVSGERYPDLYPLQKDKNFTIFNVGSSNTVDYIAFNLNYGRDPKTGRPYVEPYKLRWFTDLRFRKAMAHALDKDTWIQNYLNGFAQPLWSALTPSSVRFYNPDVTTYPFDLDRAGALLSEMGLIDRNRDGVREDAEGNRVSFMILTAARTSRELRPIAMYIDDLRRLGVEARYQSMEVNSFYDRLWATFDWECCFVGEIGGWEVYDIAHGMFASWQEYRFFKPNLFQNAPIPENVAHRMAWEGAIDRLLLEYQRELDVEKRRQIGFEIQKVLSDELPVIWTVVYDRLYAIRNKFDNFNPTVYFWPAIWGGMEWLYVKE